jgi:hypothetical protein
VVLGVNPLMLQLERADVTAHGAIIKLRDKNLLREFRWCRDAAVALTDFAMRLEFVLVQI